MKTVKKLLEIARGELGYHEKNSSANLDEKTASNDGSGNYTKYARDLAEAGYYQASKQGYEWCDVFVDWCFWMLCGKDRAAAEKMTCQTGVYGAGCEFSAGYYKNQGRLSSMPQVGDQAFFGNRDHTGIVSAVNGNAVTVIEGNKNHRVEENTYHLGDGWLSNEFGHPYFDAEEVPAPTPKPDPQPESVYVVKGGDTLWDIANAHGTTVEKLAQLNSIQNPSLIFVGQEIKIPGSSPRPKPNGGLRVGDKVRMDANATVYGSNSKYSSWVYNSDLYVREIDGDRIVISTQREGAVTGPVDRRYLHKG